MGSQDLLSHRWDLLLERNISAGLTEYACYSGPNPQKALLSEHVGVVRPQCFALHQRGQFYEQEGAVKKCLSERWAHLGFKLKCYLDIWTILYLTSFRSHGGRDCYRRPELDQTRTKPAWDSLGTDWLDWHTFCLLIVWVKGEPDVLQWIFTDDRHLFLCEFVSL